MPLVSVVIPTYNSEAFVTKAVESVLGQTVRDFELIVVDDGSTDRTREALAGYTPAVRYFRQANAGVSNARNRGIAESSGRYVGFLDADDTWYPQKLERQLDALSQSAGAGLCYTGYAFVEGEGRVVKLHRPYRPDDAFQKLVLWGNIVGPPSTVLVERALLERTGGFDPALSQCADWDMWIRLARHTPFVAIEEPLVGYLRHANNMSHNTPLLERDSVRVVEKAFADPSMPPELRVFSRRAEGRNWMMLAGSYFRSGRFGDFARCALRALRRDPGQSSRLLSYPFRRIVPTDRLPVS